MDWLAVISHGVADCEVITILSYSHVCHFGEFDQHTKSRLPYDQQLLVHTHVLQH